MVICVDTREKPRAISRILAEFDRQGVKYVRFGITFADYFNPLMPGLVIDRKRFVREIERCKAAGCRMIVLVEHGNRIRKLEDVISWKNPRLRESPYAVSGERLFKIMKAMADYYGIEWRFCNKQSTGKKIIEILGGELV